MSALAPRMPAMADPCSSFEKKNRTPFDAMGYIPNLHSPHSDPWQRTLVSLISAFPQVVKSTPPTPRIHKAWMGALSLVHCRSQNSVAPLLSLTRRRTLMLNLGASVEASGLSLGAPIFGERTRVIR